MADRSPSGPINYLFLSEILVIVVVLIFFFFFWSRVVGSAVGWGLRQWMWRRYKIWVEFDALQISPLSGHIIFKDLRYHSADMSLRALHGHIAWRYWIWRVRDTTLTTGLEEGAGGTGNAGKKKKELPCRIHVRVHGLEWFLYNRSPAYNEIIRRMEEQVEMSATEDDSQDSQTSGARKRSAWHHEERHRSDEDHRRSSNERSAPFDNAHIKPPIPTAAFEPPSVETTAVSTDWLREALPLEVEIITGSLVVGNDATPSLMILGFKGAEGTYSAEAARDRVDPYKEVYHFRLDKPKLVFRSNHDYAGPILDHGREVYKNLAEATSSGAPPPTLSSLKPGTWSDFVKRFPFLSVSGGKGRPSEKEYLQTWAGLPRFKPGGSGALPTKQEKEYAKKLNILEANECTLEYATDVAGLVQPNARVFSTDEEPYDVGNGGLAPEWRMSIRLKGAKIEYGPWADRQRDALQTAFTPAIFSHATQTPRLTAGQPRLHTTFKINIVFEDEGAMEIPTREPSKDWEYDSSSSSKLHSQRRFGWLALKVGALSRIEYNMPLVASPEGYKSSLKVDLTKLSVSSSVTSQDFIHAGHSNITCDMPSPLQWNAQRKWMFMVVLRSPKIFLIRDHITLLSDLAKDWTSGPGSDFYHFVPYVYGFKLDLIDYALHLNLNDHNIIDAPTRVEDNVFLILSGRRLNTKVDIPSTQYKQQTSVISLLVDAPDIGVDITLPEWNTHSSFSLARIGQLGRIGSLLVDGTYLFYAETHPDHVETLTLDILARQVSFKSLGWAIRYLLRIRDNYFGSFTNFSTTEEYRTKQAKRAIGDPVDEKYRPGQADVFEVILNLVIQDATLMLSEELHDFRRAVIVTTPEIQVSLRLHDFFMEVVLDLQPLRLVSGVVDDGKRNQCIPDSFDNGRPFALMIDGLRLTGNRLFGPQPRTAVYLCVWEVEVGRIAARLSPALLASLQYAVRAFAVTFTDKSNSPPSTLELAVDPDITFFRAAVVAVDAKIALDGSELSVELPFGATVETNDLATAEYRSMTSVEIPQFDVRVLVQPASRSENWWEVTAFSGDIYLDTYSAPPGWEEGAQAQAAFVLAEDKLTGRISHLYPGMGTAAATHKESLYLPPVIVPRRPSRPRWARMPTESDISSEFDLLAERGGFTSSEESEEFSDSLSNRSSSRRPASDSFSRAGSFATAFEDFADLDAAHSFSEDDSDFSEEGSVSSLASSVASGSTAAGISSRLVILPHSPFASQLLRVPVRSRSEDVSCGPASIKTGKPEGASSSPKVAPGAGQAALEQNEILTPSKRSELVIRVQTRREMRGVFTPLSLNPLKQLLVGLSGPPASPERVLDDLLDDEIDRASQKLSRTAPSFAVDLKIHSIRLKSVQRVLEPHQAKELALVVSDNPAAQVADVYAIIAIDLDGFVLAAQNTPLKADPAKGTPNSFTGHLSAGVDSGTLCVHHASDFDRAANPQLANLAAQTNEQDLQLVTKELRLAATSTPAKTTAYLSLGDSELRFVDFAAELIIGTLYETLAWSRELDRVHSELSRREKARVRDVFTTILQQADRRGIETSPSCLRPGSYLVQSNTTRQDVGSQLLARMRHRYRCLGPDAFAPVQPTIPRGSDLPLRAPHIILRQWSSEWADTSSPAEIRLLSKVLGIAPTAGSVPQPASPLPSYLEALGGRAASFTFNTGRLRADHQGRRGRNALRAGSLILGPYAFAAEVWREVASSPSASVLHLAVDSSLGVGEVEMSPSLLLVMQHILHVRKIFETKMIALEVAVLSTREDQSPPMKRTELLGCGRVEVEATIAFSQGQLDLVVDDLAVRLSGKNGLVTSKVSWEFGVISGRGDLDSPEAIVVGEVISHLHEMHFSAAQIIQETPTKSIRQVLLALDLAAGGGRFEAQPMVVAGHPSAYVAAVFTFERLRASVPAKIPQLASFYDAFAVKTIPTFRPLVNQLLEDLVPAQSSAPVASSRGPAVTAKTMPTSSTGPLFFRLVDFHATLLLKHLDFNVRINRQLWVVWTFRDILSFADRKELALAPAVSAKFGLQLGSQSILFVSPREVIDVLPIDLDAEDVSELRLPLISCSGSYHEDKMNLLLAVDAIDAILKPSSLDNLIPLFHSGGGDIEDLVETVRSRLPAKAAQAATSTTEVPSSSPPAISSSPPTITVRLALRGIKIGLQTPSKTLYFQASLLQGRFQSRPRSEGECLWSFSVSELGLSLVQKSRRSSIAVSANQRAPFAIIADDHRHRTATMKLDIVGDNAPAQRTQSSTGGLDQAHLERPSDLNFRLHIDRVHAVVQPSAFGEVADGIDYFVREARARARDKKAEIQAFKESSQRLFHTREPSQTEAPAPVRSPVTTWFDNRLVTFEVTNVGIALPLPSVHAAPSQGAAQRATSTALLFSLRRVDFTKLRHETGCMTLEQAAVQFVTSFDQTDERSFNGLSHDTCNRFLLPSLACDIQGDASEGVRKLWVKALVSGFNLELDSTLPGYVHALSDVYTLGKRRLARLAKENDLAVLASGLAVAAPQTSEAAPSKPLSIQALFEFESGTVSLTSYADFVAATPSTAPTSIPSAAPRHRQPPDDFDLPSLTTWIEYRHYPETARTSPDAQRNIALVTATLSGTQNAFKPSILPFVQQIIAASYAPRQTLTSSPEVQTVALPSLVAAPAAAPAAVSNTMILGTEISASLRLVKTVVLLECASTDPAEAILTWEEGGLVFTKAAHTGGWAVSGAITGIQLTVSSTIRSIQPESLRLRAQNLAVSFSSFDTPDTRIAQSAENATRPTKSLTLDTEFSAALNFENYEDILTLKAVYLDRISLPDVASSGPSPPSNSPALTKAQIISDPFDSGQALFAPSTLRLPTASGFSQLGAETESNASTAPVAAPAASPLFLLLLRVRHVQLAVETDATALVFEINNVVVRRRSSGDRDGWHVTCEIIGAQAKNRLSGYLRIPRLSIHTERWLRKELSPGRSSRIIFQVETGHVESFLMYDEIMILRLRCGPLQLKAFDDWTGFSSNRQEVGLDFSFNLGKLDLGITGETVPKLLDVIDLFKTQYSRSQKKAERDSASRRAAMVSKPINALSSLAKDAVESARAKLTADSKDTFNLDVLQTVVLESEGIRILIFPGSTSTAQVDLGPIRARLHQILSSEQAPRRDLDLRLGFLRILKHDKKLSSISNPTVDGQADSSWFTEEKRFSSIVALPPTSMSMQSQEDPVRTINYDFRITFEGGVEPSLNYVDIMWMGDTVKMLQKHIMNHLEDPQTADLAPPLDLLEPPSTAAPSTPQKELPDLSSAGGATTSPKSPPFSSGPLQTATPYLQEGSGITYIKGKEDIPPVQLTWLREATPRFKWLQDQFSKSAIWTHEWATLPMSALSEGLVFVYRKQLPKP